jgi:hypothetical protein
MVAKVPRNTEVYSKEHFSVHMERLQLAKQLEKHMNY